MDKILFYDSKGYYAILQSPEWEALAESEKGRYFWEIGGLEVPTWVHTPEAARKHTDEINTWMNALIDSVLADRG